MESVCCMFLCKQLSVRLEPTLNDWSHPWKRYAHLNTAILIAYLQPTQYNLYVVMHDTFHIIGAYNHTACAIQKGHVFAGVH